MSVIESIFWIFVTLIGSVCSYQAGKITGEKKG